MLHRLIPFILLALASPALADGVPGTWDGPGQQSTIAPVIGADGVYTEALGNGVNPAGGIPSFYSLQSAVNDGTVTSSCTGNACPQIEVGTDHSSTTGDDEFKIRFTLEGSHLLPVDPLRAHCNRNGSHLHEFLGNPATGACSSYSQLRSAAVANFAAGKLASTSPGNDVNGTGYWQPAMIDCGGVGNPGALGDVVCRAKKVRQVPFYYQVPIIARANTFIDLPRDQAYIYGRNMSDPLNLKYKRAITAANEANINAGGAARYSAPAGNGPWGDGFIGWSCDPDINGGHDNLEDLDCAEGSDVIAELHAPICVDGKNLHSPSGYDHVSQPFRVEGTNIDTSDGCWNGWFKIPALVNKPQWRLTRALSSSVDGDAPYLSSDAMFQAAVRAQAAAEVAADPVRAEAEGIDDYLNFVCKAGCSMHADWMGAWNDFIIKKAFRDCLAVPNTLDPSSESVNGEGCNSNTISPPSKSDIALTSGHLNISSDRIGDTIDDYYPIPLRVTGPATITDNN